jgi:hypothetical protein
MAEVNRLKRKKQIGVENIEPEERQELPPDLRVLHGGKQLTEDIQALDHLMFEHEVMPDSFIMPELYQRFTVVNGERVFAELEKAKRNKLITGWFTKIFQTLETICRQYDFDRSGIGKLNQEFKILIGEEEEAALDLIHQSLVGKRLEQLSPEELPRIIKEGKKSVAHDFLARKMDIIHRIEELADEVKQRLCPANVIMS